MAGHAIVPLDQRMTASFGLVLAASAHAVGWPVARGGSQSIADAMLRYLAQLGVPVLTGRPVRSPDDLPPARVTLWDISAAQFLDIFGPRLRGRYRRQLVSFRRGEGVFKLDYALSAPVPWKGEVCGLAGTVHLGGTLEEIVAAEQEVAQGKLPANPFVLAVQSSRFDHTRVPDGKETLWAYCHVPNGSTADMTYAVEAQIERFAPGFRDVVLARSTMGPAEIEAHNPSMAGGDIAAGSNAGLQILFRPGLRLNPYSTPLDGVYLCSASTPPGSGVHGMCGELAARAVLRRELA
jgi:phytoene dehydrogenase-like protein